MTQGLTSIDRHVFTYRMAKTRSWNRCSLVHKSVNHKYKAERIIKGALPTLREIIRLIFVNLLQTIANQLGTHWIPYTWILARAGTRLCRTTDGAMHHFLSVPVIGLPCKFVHTKLGPSPAACMQPCHIIILIDAVYQVPYGTPYLQK